MNVPIQFLCMVLLRLLNRRGALAAVALALVCQGCLAVGTLSKASVTLDGIRRPEKDGWIELPGIRLLFEANNYQPRVVFLGPVPIPLPSSDDYRRAEFLIYVSFDPAESTFSITPGLIQLEIDDGPPLTPTMITGPRGVLMYSGPRYKCAGNGEAPPVDRTTSLPITERMCFSFSFDCPTPKASTDFRLTLLGLTKAGEKMLIPVQFEKRYQVILEGN